MWLFVNSGRYWNVPAVGTLAVSMGAYMKVIVLLTFVGVFVKIPLGVLLYHYRNIDPSKQYLLDLGYFKLQMTPNQINPISDALAATQLGSSS